MPRILDLRDDLYEYINKHALKKKWQKAIELFEKDPSHPSLHTELLKPKHRLIYSFRIDRKYRALFIVKEEELVEVIAITKHYRK
ncbi:hypothetical protein BMS3Abin08_01046 [bacterium BMS3Abin08]|nr:hypothetical protein BMS3Abin08_01046 [bacterium BMS3Abin08]HDZ62645.1 hypothetical protein [Nitrospirota bacterium]